MSKIYNTRSEAMSFFGFQFRASYLFLLCLFLVRGTIAQTYPADESFHAGVTELGAEPHVSAIQADGKILVGGSYDLVNGTTRPRLARLNQDGTTDTGFNVGGLGPDDYIED